MKIILKFLTIIFIFLSFQTSAIEKGKWNFVKTDEYCYIGSLSIETDLSPEKQRGEYYILVYKNIGNPDVVVQIEAGYDYKIGEDIIVKIDKGDYIFYTTKDLPSVAWTDNDDKVIFAMKKGLELIVTGQSSRGTVTNDKYTLKGFTAAHNKLIENC